MKLMHISDLHLGKRVNEFSMLEDQRFILAEIVRIAAEERPQALLIAGDVYDRTVPPAEAVELFDSFLTSLAALDLQVFIISGNHDSPERLSFGGRLMDRSGVHFAPVYGGSSAPFILKDEYGEVLIWMLPFVKPASVRPFFPDCSIEDHSDAVRTAIEAMAIDPSQRNVLLCHQFAAGSERCESEEITVGGEGAVDVAVFKDFDYVALGHLHGPQNVGSERIRYCGSPLKYSFSEVRQEKSLTLAELGPKGELSLRTVPLIPQRDMKELRGTYGQLSLLSFYKDLPAREAYLHVTLTDEDDIPEAMAKLQVIYPYLMRLDYDNARTRSRLEVSGPAALQSRTPLELFEELYSLQNGAPMSDEQRDYLNALISRIWEEER